MLHKIPPGRTEMAELDELLPTFVSDNDMNISNLVHDCKSYYKLISKMVSILDAFVAPEVAGVGGCNLDVSHDVENCIVSISYGVIIEEEQPELAQQDFHSDSELEGWISDDEQCEEVSQDVANVVIDEILLSQPEAVRSISLDSTSTLQNDNFQMTNVTDIDKPEVVEEQQSVDDSAPFDLDSDSSIGIDNPAKKPKLAAPSSGNGNTIYVCQYVDCPRTFFRAYEYFYHVQNAHTPPVDGAAIELRCKHINCQKRFNSIELLQEHHSTHVTKRKHKKRLSAGGNSNERASQTKRTKCKTVARARACEYCDTELDVKVNVYEQHCLEAHNHTPYFCALCAAPFPLRSHMAYHKKTEHSLNELEIFLLHDLWREFTTRDGAQLAECRYCYKVLHTQKRRDEHAELHRKEIRVTCGQCGLKHYESVCRLAKLKEGTKLAQVQCEKCDRWMSKKSFKDHLRTHASERTFPCTVCKKTFKERRTAVRHIQSHVNASNQKRKCYDCATVLEDEGDIVEHYQAQHPQLRPYRCPMCNEGFYEKSLLADHCHRHTDEERRMVSVKKPVESYQIGSACVYECTMCRRPFSTKRASLAHSIMHTDRPHLCTHCNLTFRENISLITHLAAEHQIIDPAAFV